MIQPEDYQPGAPRKFSKIFTTPHFGVHRGTGCSLLKWVQPRGRWGPKCSRPTAHSPGPRLCGRRLQGWRSSWPWTCVCRSGSLVRSRGPRLPRLAGLCLLCPHRTAGAPDLEREARARALGRRRAASPLCHLISSKLWE